MEKTGTNAKIKIGDIFSCSWGYEQTNIDFYIVVGLAGKTMIYLQKIGSKNHEVGQYSDLVLPNASDIKGVKIKRKVYDYNSPGVMISSFQWASLWDGKPEEQTNSLYGH
tara:strand:- start:1982 stop:2311 length:330 start_codon:yes stop_codon:yes gene_type:complete